MTPMITYVSKNRIKTPTARKVLSALVGDSATLLFLFYVEKRKENYYSYTDVDVAIDLGWKPSKVKTMRQKLMDIGWFTRSELPNKKNPNALAVCITLGHVKP
jgi:hypothetical protein